MCVCVYVKDTRRMNQLTLAGGLVVGAAVSSLQTVLGAVASVLLVPLLPTALRGALEAAL